MNKSNMNKAFLFFKDAKLINLNAIKRKPTCAPYESKPRSNSFENSLKRVLLNNHEMKSLKTQNKRKRFFQSFVEEEEDYNKLITTKMLQFGKLFNKIPHPSLPPSKQLKTISKMNHREDDAHLEPLALPTVPSEVPQLKAGKCLFFSESLPLENKIELNPLVEALKEKISNLFIYEVKGISPQSKVLKRKATVYKYISDEQSRMYFHYFSSDFSLQSQGSPEYKYIKIKEESFKVIRALLKVKQMIIDDYYSHSIHNDYIKCCKGKEINDMIDYLEFLGEIYQFYVKENEDLLHNYSVVTRNLVNDDKLYLIYIKDLCSVSESIILEEMKFKADLDLARRAKEREVI